MSITEKLNKIKSCKEDIKQAIIDKGVDMTGVSLEGYATKITEIQTGGGSGDYLDIRANLSTYYSTVEKVDGYAFIYCSTIKSIDLPMCINVGSYAFASCSSLQSINLPNCSYVSTAAFASCSSLQSINLPNCSYVETLGFTRCSNIQSIDLPNCINLGNYAFNFNPTIQSVNIPVCNNIGNNAFDNCTSLSVLDLRSTYGCVLSNSNAFSKTPFASGIGSIYVHAAHLSQFQNATNWTYFSKCFVGVGDPTRPLLSFDNGRVYGDIYHLCSSKWQSDMGILPSSVISIDLPNCKYIYNSAFHTCYNLQSVNLPNCSYVGISVFVRCSSLQSVNLPNCSYVDNGAFIRCSSLQSVNLPNCSYVGNYAFQFCSSISTIYIGTSISTVCEITNSIFAQTNSSFSVFVPMSLVDAYKSALYWSNYASQIFGV